ncbi:MAG TPA: hypothetical protein VEJ19_07560 [Nitrososphaerales archaeon]|nr:hypothetical protein [Nitrososphaerales archaeon]
MRTSFNSRRGISSLLLIIVALIPLVLVIDFALLYASFPDAPRYVGIIDVPILVVVSVAFVLSRKRKAQPAKQEATPTTALDKLRERNGGRRAPTGSGESILDHDEVEEAGVFMGTPDYEKRARDVDEILQRTKAREMSLGAGHDNAVDAHLQPLFMDPDPPAEKQLSEPEVKAMLKNYVLSPEKLKIPAFVCRCGHAHRFVCLTCGITVEQAAKKSKTHWVEWVPAMGTLP